MKFTLIYMSTELCDTLFNTFSSIHALLYPLQIQHHIFSFSFATFPRTNKILARDSQPQ